METPKRRLYCRLSVNPLRIMTQMNTRKFSIINQTGERLACVEVKPEDYTGIMPVVILCHGFAYVKEEDGIFIDIAQKLAVLGYAAYYFDFSGCGESEGDYAQTTLTKLVADLDAVRTYVQTLDYVNFQDLSLISHSFGSSVIIASQVKYLKRIVMTGAFAKPVEVISKLFVDFNEFGVSSRPNSRGRKTTIESQFWSDLRSYDTEKLIANFECPILFIHGDKDTLVPIEYVQPLVASAKRPVGPVVLAGAGHDLRPKREEAYRAIVDFFSRQP